MFRSLLLIILIIHTNGNYIRKPRKLLNPDNILYDITGNDGYNEIIEEDFNLKIYNNNV